MGRFQIVYFEKIRVFKAGELGKIMNILAWDNRIRRYSYFKDKTIGF